MRTLILLLLSFLSSACVAQSKVDFSLAAADLTIRTLDIVSTHQLLASPCNCFHEDDPLSPGGKSVLPLALFQVGISAALIESSRLLEHRGHRRIGRLLLLVDITSESIAVSHNMTRSAPPPRLTHGSGLTLVPAIEGGVR